MLKKNAKESEKQPKSDEHYRNEFLQLVALIDRVNVFDFWCVKEQCYYPIERLAEFKCWRCNKFIVLGGECDPV